MTLTLALAFLFAPVVVTARPQGGVAARPTLKLQNVQVVQAQPPPNLGLLQGVLKEANAAGAQRWVKVETLRALGAAERDAKALALVNELDSGAIDVAGLELRLQRESPALAERLDVSKARVVTSSLHVNDSAALASSPFLASFARAPIDVVHVNASSALLALPPQVEESGRFQFRREGEELRAVGDFHGLPVERGRPVWIFDKQRTAAPLAASAEQGESLCHVLVNNGPSSDGATADVRLFAVWAAFSQSPLVWSPTDNAYATDVHLGLRLVAAATNAPLDGVELPVLLSTRGAHAEVAPAQLRVTPSDAALARARFRVPRHAGGAVELLTWLGGEALAHTVEVRPSAARLELMSSTTSADGLGLGRVSLWVERFAEDGEPLVSAPELRVGLAVDPSVRGPAELIIPAGQSRSAALELRTDGLGEHRFVAQAGALSSAPRALRFALPWLYFALCLIGGALGGALKLGASRRKDDRLSRRMLIGAGVGLIVVMARVSGVWRPETLPDGVVDYGLGAFALAGLAGFLGRSGLDAVLNKLGLGGGSKPTPDAK